MDTTWGRMNPFHQVGLRTAAVPAVANGMPGIARSSGPALSDSHSAHFSPDSPLFWFAAIAAVTVGLVATSTSFRVGPVRVSASAGKS